MHTVAIVQARMGSSRLPGKVLLPLGEGQTLLDAVLDSLSPLMVSDSRSTFRGGQFSCPHRFVASVVVATTTQPEDDPIVHHCQARQVAVFRGDAENVLNRFLKAAEVFHAEAVLRVCADNPLLDPQLIHELLRFADQRRPDYAGYQTVAGVPAICTPGGLTAEWVTVEALHRLAQSTPSPQMAEHVTLGIYSQSGYDTAWLPLPEWADQDWLRLTCDTKEDWDRLRYIFAAGPVRSARQELLRWIAQQPALVQAMQQANQAQPKSVVLIPQKGKSPVHTRCGG